jgi:hypothetical protein
MGARLLEAAESGNRAEKQEIHTRLYWRIALKDREGMGLVL